MGLDQVIAEVRQDGEGRANKILGDARAEAERIMEDAQARVAQNVAERQAQAEKEARHLREQIASGADFEARKILLEKEAALRQELRRQITEGFRGLPGDIRKEHVRKLIEEARSTLDAGRVWCAKQDRASVEGQGVFEFAGTRDIAGGVIVESEDGTMRLDLSYETLLGDMWRDILRAESGLFDT